MNITYKQTKTINLEQVENLYNDVGWTAYTKNMDLLQQALLQSLDVISAWDGDQLVGLIRTVGDGLTILYIQDILVLDAYQNQGIASKLLQMVLQKHETVRQKVLLTEEAPDVRHFYEKNGFESCDKGSVVAFGRFQ
ncbi:GNAT family N-acetyltransferase [Lysinibacillus odysseyi]|uniref:GNAT family acetyltraansferase n=1 Tax=Lysinibacillus odysseyi 34hs-1 = NBRC 100172 TaxID=1220589 RepID=A0A0A3ING4_9BACI|nr:GNAT family N-acetyltransferase [Lysinibacillus odysseyi]KGR84358.1 GNAT family acetyltraansferase [Lysinibacillus odysseyi 34hs-1 = NBRC 100172]